MIQHMSNGLQRRSVVLVERLDAGHRQILFYWTVVASFACGVRLAAGSFSSLPVPSQIISGLPYVLIVGAPIVSVLLAFHWFRDADRMPQPAIRLARFGKWRQVTHTEAKRYAYFGVTGIMASLLLGILLNIPVRALEFLAAMPTLGAAPPAWFGTLYGLMFLDVVLFSSLYAIAFVAGLRRMPLFPRLLAVIWAFDVLMQIGIARAMGQVEHLPATVSTALFSLLLGNLQKVLISFALWAPYLLLSRRVNATFRHRLPVDTTNQA